MSLTKVSFSMINGMFKTPEDYGATGGANDTIAVQAAFDSGFNVIFIRNYNVDSVIASTIGQTIDFNGYTLTGIRPAGGSSAQYVMGISGRYMKLYSVNVNANFGPYGSCVRWFSVSNALPAQNNNVYGMSLSYCLVGLTFGQDIGSPSVDAAQSENAIYGFTSRGLQTPFVGNQSNGFITLVSPILDCNPNEWSLQPGYNATTWGTNSVALNNIVGSVTVVSGEILKTTSQLGYGIRGLGVNFLGTTLEIACSQGYILGSMLFRDTLNGYMSADSASAFVVYSGATGTLSLLNIQASRGAGVSSYSGALFISYESTTNAFNVVIEDGLILEWKIPYICGRTVSFINSQVIESTGDVISKLNDNDNCLLRQNGVDTLIYSTTGWYLNVTYGAGSTLTIGTAAPSGKNAASLELLATGVAYASSGDTTSTATVKNTSLGVIPGEYYRVVGWVKSTGNSTVIVVYFNIAGTQITSVVLTPTITSSWVNYSTVTQVPATAAYMIIQGGSTTSTLNLTDFAVTRFVKPV